MRRTWGVLIILLMLSAPLVVACFSPADLYAVEVVLNKPGITYDPTVELPTLLKVGEKTFLLRVWEDEYPHVRVEIPRTRRLGAYWNYSGILLIAESNITELKELGWELKSLGENGSPMVFIKGNVTIEVSPPSNSSRECTSDRDCSTGGCSGELCLPRGEAAKVVTPCVYKPWYSCFELTSCGCVNGICTWKPNENFENCLKKHGIDPSKVIRIGPSRVEATGPSPEELSRALKEFFAVFGVNCTEIEIKSGSKEGYAYNTSQVDAGEVIKAALKLLVEYGAVEGLSEEDIEEIAAVAEWGKAGPNSHIGWYETDKDTYAWIPYDESKNPLLVRCGSAGNGTGGEESNTGNLGVTNSSEAPVSAFGEETSETASNSTNSTCGPGVLALFSLLVLAARFQRSK